MTNEPQPQLQFHYQSAIQLINPVVSQPDIPPEIFERIHQSQALGETPGEKCAHPFRTESATLRVEGSDTGNGNGPMNSLFTFGT